MDRVFVVALLVGASFFLGAGVLLGRALYGRGRMPLPSNLAGDSSLVPVFQPQDDEALRKRNAIFAKVFNLVPETLTITRISDGRYVEVNHNWQPMIGYAKEDAIGHTSAELNVWAESAQRQRIVETIRQDGEIHGVDATFKHKDGHLLYAKVSASLFESDSEQYMMLAVQDVTAQREAQQQIVELNQQLEQRVQQRTLNLEQANAELAATLQTLRHAKDELVKTDKLAALGSLVAGVAHELNTPIGNSLTVATTLDHRVKALDGQMTTGLRRSDLDQFVSDAKFAVDVLVRNLMRAGDLIRSFKQVAADRASAQRRVFTMQELVSETLITLNPTIRRSRCEVKLEIDEGIKFDSYPGPLGQVLDNLINNALTHGFVDGREGCIWISGCTAGTAGVTLSVRDNGVGIPVENQSRIFDPFFTTRLGQGGSGLGLHIAYNLVTDILGGRIEVQSVPGAGATFLVHLPLRAPEPGADAQLAG
jgi:PAS domain S-box-containing protein